MPESDRKLHNLELGRISTEEYRTLPPCGITVVLDNIRSAHNVGSVFRTADAFGIDGICLCGITPVPPGAEIHKSALGAEDSVKWERYARTMDAVDKLRAEGYTIVSIEQTVNSVKMDKFDAYGEGNPKYAVVFGNEVDGVDQEVVDNSDFSLEIPQFGSKHSLNVSVCAGAVLWHFRLNSLHHGWKR
ncbi:MAG: RNA methyltransferase [Candidatus Cryptobacteroides sp.]